MLTLLVCLPKNRSAIQLSLGKGRCLADFHIKNEATLLWNSLRSTISATQGGICKFCFIGTFRILTEEVAILLDRCLYPCLRFGFP